MERKIPDATQGFNLSYWTTAPFTKPENTAGRDQALEEQVVRIAVVGRKECIQLNLKFTLRQLWYV